MKKLLLSIFSYILLALINLGCTNGESKIMNKAITIDFPLHGVWVTPNTPGKKIPSHGIDMYGETYAYDFVGVGENERTDKFYKISVISYLMNGARLEKCYGWGSEIYAPFDGEVISTEDGVTERNPVNVGNDLRYAIRITKEFKSGKAEYKDIAGNYIILKYSENVYALFAHMQKNSIEVKPGKKIKKGQVLGKVGHSGNSTAPHLHFQLMDNADPIESKGILCNFTNYEEFRNGKWIDINNGIPSKYRIRNH
jgi:hypothetical protein